MEHYRKDIIELIRFAAALATACLFLYITEIGCPIRFLTGICCPGCGISRAILAALSGNIVAAFHYHPLFWYPLVWLVLWIFRQHFSNAQVKFFLLASIILYLAVYLFRMVSGSDIVFCRPQTGMIYRMISWCIRALS